MARERWRNAPGHPGYRTSSNGRVKSVDRMLTDGRACGGTMLAQYEDDDGYLHVTIGGKPVAVHLLVLEAFHGPRPPGMEGCHDPVAGQKANTAALLRWDSRRENERDKRRKRRLELESRARPFSAGTPETGELAVE